MDMIKDPAKIWLPDVKSIGTGPTAERVDLVQFNAPLIRELRACLDDIAAELGDPRDTQRDANKQTEKESSEREKSRGQIDTYRY